MGAKKAEKKLKKQKDPNRPKRAPSAYFIFMSDARAQVKREMPDAGVTVIGKRLGEIWRNLDAEEKAVYQNRHVQLKEEADIALEEYKSSDECKAFQARVSEAAAKVSKKKVKSVKKVKVAKKK